MLLNILKAKINLMTIKGTQLKVNVRHMAGEMGVDFKWALERRRAYLDDVVRSIEGSMASTLAANLAGANELELVLINNYISEANEVINKLKTHGKGLKAENRNGITNEMIQKAKGYPIAELLPNPVRRNVTNCIAHDDAHPSMGIKDNRAYCYVCGFKGDTIDVAMQLNHIDFRGAVKTLIH